MENEIRTHSSCLLLVTLLLHVTLYVTTTSIVALSNFLFFVIKIIEYSGLR